MAQWLRTLTGGLCILTVLLHLIPRGKFSGYVRFYGGLLFFLVASGPLWKLLAGEGELERILQLAFLRDGGYDLESSIAGMADLKNDRIREAYQSELVRQIREIASAYGLSASDIRLTFGEKDGYQMTGVSFSAGMLREDTLSGTQGQATQARGDPGEWERAAESVRQELAGVYMLDPARVRIVREETG